MLWITIRMKEDVIIHDHDVFGVHVEVAPRSKACTRAPDVLHWMWAVGFVHRRPFICHESWKHESWKQWITCVTAVMQSNKTLKV